MQVWDTSTGERLSSPARLGQGSGDLRGPVYFSNDGKYVLGTVYNNPISILQMWDLNTGDTVASVLGSQIFKIDDSWTRIVTFDNGSITLYHRQRNQ